MGIASEHLTGQQMADIFSEVYGKKVKYNAVEPKIYRSFDFPGADDLGNMFQFKADFEDYFCGIRDIERTKALNPEVQTFKEWLQINKSKMEV